MFKYFLKRISLMLFTFVITVFIYFVFIKMIPDNHVSGVGQDDIWYEKFKALEGWDKPIIVQFGLWVKNIFTTGSFGVDSITGRDVSEAYFSKIPASIKINIVPYLLSIPLAIGLGVTAALYKNKWPDTIISIGVIIFISVPFFVVAVLSQYIFHFKLGWASSYQIAPLSEMAIYGRWHIIKSYIFPVIILTITGIPGLTRSIRAELTEQLTQDYILLARSKGLTRQQATFRHALKNAMVPFLPGIFIGIIGVMSGGIITEQIFRVDGTGRIYLAAFNSRNFPMLMLITVFGQFLTLLTSIVGDLSYTLFDPRVRIGGGKIA
ncbi:MAG: ABC transporter permease [Acholeplasmataceae bacterium]|jgi:peptide/nickel transport system permease protein/oligopeptide transport system permease protein|nr:ABC transporter permease [Acholeplasmataceae bacterium]